MSQYVVGEGLKLGVAESKQSYSFSINGVVELPNLTVISSPRHVGSAFDILTARVTAKVAGSTTYTFVIKSYDSSGGDEVTHINDTAVLGAKTILDLDIAIETVGANRTLELSIQSSSGTFAEDITVTIGE
jgi:hypothetical protein